MVWRCSDAEPDPARFEEPPCLVCGSDRRRVLANNAELQEQAAALEGFFRARLLPDTPPEMLADKTDFTQCYPTNIVACPGCGLVYRCPRPRPGAVVEEYVRDHYTREKMDEMFASERAFYGRKVGGLLRRLPSGSRVLEVGSFVGAFLDAARAAGWEATGVDVGAEAIAYTRARGLDAQQGQLFDVRLPASSFDAIFIWNCFDQMPDPRPALYTARALLRPGGLLVIRVPNGASYRLGMRLLHRAHSPRLREGLRRALALNNLLTFPYLYGHTAGTLRCVLSSCALRTRGFLSDVLVSLADRYTCPWAAVEERRTKAAIRFLSNLVYLISAGRWEYAPWIEAFATK